MTLPHQVWKSHYKREATIRQSEARTETPKGCHHEQSTASISQLTVWQIDLPKMGWPRASCRMICSPGFKALFLSLHHILSLSIIKPQDRGWQKSTESVCRLMEALPGGVNHKGGQGARVKEWEMWLPSIGMRLEAPFFPSRPCWEYCFRRFWALRIVPVTRATQRRDKRPRKWVREKKKKTNHQQPSTSTSNPNPVRWGLATVSMLSTHPRTASWVPVAPWQKSIQPKIFFLCEKQELKSQYLWGGQVSACRWGPADGGTGELYRAEMQYSTPPITGVFQRNKGTWCLRCHGPFMRCASCIYSQLMLLHYPVLTDGPPAIQKYEVTFATHQKAQSSN